MIHAVFSDSWRAFWDIFWSVASASRRPSFGRLFHWSTTSSVHLLPSSAPPRWSPYETSLSLSSQIYPNMSFLRPLNMVSGGMFCIWMRDGIFHGIFHRSKTKLAPSQMGTIGISPSVITLWHFRRHSADGAGWREILRDAADEPQDLTNSVRQAHKDFPILHLMRAKSNPVEKHNQKPKSSQYCAHM